jgi:hypothetical protein
MSPGEIPDKKRFIHKQTLIKKKSLSQKINKS